MPVAQRTMICVGFLALLWSEPIDLGAGRSVEQGNLANLDLGGPAAQVTDRRLQLANPRRAGGRRTATPGM